MLPFGFEFWFGVLLWGAFTTPNLTLTLAPNPNPLILTLTLTPTVGSASVDLFLEMKSRVLGRLGFKLTVGRYNKAGDARHIVTSRLSFVDYPGPSGQWVGHDSNTIRQSDS